MKLNTNQQAEINQLKDDFKKYKSEQKSELKNKLSSSETFKFEKPIIKEEFKSDIHKANLQLKHDIKNISDPEFFKKDGEQRKVENEILDLQNAYYKGLAKCERQLRKAKRIDKKDKALKDERKLKISEAKANLKEYKTTEKTKLKNEKKRLETNYSINKYREFKNSTKLTGHLAMNKIVPAANKFANQRHLLAIRNSFMSTMPLSIVGSIFMIIGTIPVGINIDSNGIQTLYNVMTWMTDVNPQLGQGFIIIQQIALGMMAVGVAFGCGLDLGESYGEHPLISGILGLFAFILWATVPVGGNTLSLNELGSKGMFTALITSIIMIELYRVFKKHNITIRLPKSVPPAIGNSFLAFIPCTIYMVAVWGIRYGAGFDLLNIINAKGEDLTNVIMKDLGWACLIAIVPSLSWWLGIHGGTFLIFFSASLMGAIQANQQWVIDGMIGEAPFLYCNTFFNSLCWMGGGGGIIGLALSGMIFAKSKQNKAIARASFIPALFNISEPIMFGYPVVLNIFFLIPFILAPLGTVLLATPFMNLMDIRFVAPPQQLPSIILGVICTGNNWKGILTVLLIAAWDTLIYAPFFIIFDRVKVKEEREANIKEANELGLTLRELLIEREKKNIKVKKDNLFTKAFNKNKVKANV